jgi:hypothetical protein
MHNINLLLIFSFSQNFSRITSLATDSDYLLALHLCVHANNTKCDNKWAKIKNRVLILFKAKKVRHSCSVHPF